MGFDGRLGCIESRVNNKLHMKEKANESKSPEWQKEKGYGFRGQLEFSGIQAIASFPRGISTTSRRDRQGNFIPIFEQNSLQWLSIKIEDKFSHFNAELKPLE
ncbi:hypothetical protein BGX33_004490 [Mortierella sp. NVP41]|nr:hypothetical protein BGX33_004490 [Mortierella sp. NVP41]